MNIFGNRARIKELEEELLISRLRNLKLLSHVEKLETHVQDLNERIRMRERMILSAKGEVYRNPFTPDEIRSMLSLCHPDKHGGKEIATKITQKLLQLRG